MPVLLSWARRWTFRQPAWLLALLLNFIPFLIPGILRAQTAPAPATSVPEVSTHDAEPGFTLKTERNMVTVRVVVRDAKGAAVDNLGQGDFKLFDHGKPQTISSFSLERPTVKVSVLPQKPEEKAAHPETDEESSAPDTTAQRFVGLFFDDVNTKQEDLVRTRDAADRYLSSSVKPGDRVALFTSSGQQQIDFTANIAEIHKGLFELRARPIVEDGDLSDGVPPYLAYRIAEQGDFDAICEVEPSCHPCTASMCPPEAQADAQRRSLQSLSFAEMQTRADLRGLEEVIHRMTLLPGKRSIVIVSGGFFSASASLGYDLDRLVDRALRAGVTISAIDARGLYTGDITNEDIRLQSDGMRNLAHDTGGIFFENSNDLDAGFRKVAGTPEAYYLLTFSPENLKHDGAFHDLKVSLVSGKGLSVQARRGYFAPKKSEDLASQEKEMIREAVFSREETHALPIDVHTKFFMKSESDAEITVLTHIDLHTVQFRQELDRNVNTLTFVAALFDQDGNYVAAEKKVLEFKMKDETMQKYLQTGITMKSQFAVKPGNYQVRSVVCDSGSGRISGANRTVEIPY